MDADAVPDLPDPVELELRARDDVVLSGTLYPSPTDRESGRAVIINSATAVPRRFYRHFAAALAAAGYSALTWDYRGVGDSRPASLVGYEARMRDWGLLDMPGVIDSLRATRPELTRVFLVGHSVGGQVAGLIDNPDAVAGMATFSSQSGYWLYQGGLQKLVVGLHVHLTMPALARLCGTMPWSWIGGEDLPAGVALEWSRWCRDRDYLRGDPSLPLERFQDFRAPVLAWSFGDDSWGTPRAVDAMMSAYPALERRHLEPGEAGMPSIGHFGAFRPNAGEIWRRTIAWLDEQA